MFDESEDSWRKFFRCLCVSDAHAGIQAAVKKELLGASWQCCEVHLMRNILAKVPPKDKRRFAARLKPVWLRPDRKSARRASPISRLRNTGTVSPKRSVASKRALRTPSSSTASRRSTSRRSRRPMISWSTRRTGGAIGAVSNGRGFRRS